MDARRVPRAMANRLRAARLWAMTERALVPPPPSAFASLGEGVLLMTPIRVEGAEFMSLQAGVRVHEQGWLMARRLPGHPEPRLTVGRFSVFGRFTKIVCTGHVSFGDECLIADGVYIADTHHRFDDPGVPIARQPLADPKPVTVGSGVFIGRQAVIGPGVTIGDNAYIGAGTPVTKDVPPRCVLVGDPPRIIRHYDDAAGEWLDGPPA